VNAGARALLVAGVVALGGSAHAAALRLEGSVVGHDPPALRVVAHNTGDTPARDVTPAVLFEQQSYRGVPASIGAGAMHEWRLGLTPPSLPGTTPATVRVEWTNAGGGRQLLPLVVLVPVPGGAAPGPVGITWTLEPAAPVAHTRVRLENRGARPVVGRLVLVLADPLTTEPGGQPATVPANGSTTIPVAIESRGAPAGVYPAYALFTYDEDAERRAALASVPLTVARTSARSRAVPLAIGVAAVLVAAGLLAIALRASASRRPV
jgi:hypothetical protein